MRIFLIDFENINSNGLKKLDFLREGDRAIIFYSEQCSMVSMDALNVLLRQKIKISIEKVHTGSRNALDFQLASRIGYLVGKYGNKNQYIIISNDKDFDCIVAYWIEKGIVAMRIPVSNAKEPEKNKILEKNKDFEKVKEPEKRKSSKDVVVNFPTVTLEEIEAVVSEKCDPTAVMEIINSTKEKNQINNKIMKLCTSSKKAGKIYKQLKPLLREKGRG